MMKKGTNFHRPRSILPFKLNDGCWINCACMRTNIYFEPMLAVWLLINGRRDFCANELHTNGACHCGTDKHAKLAYIHEFHMRKSIYYSMSVTCQFIICVSVMRLLTVRKNHILQNPQLIYVNKKRRTSRLIKANIWLWLWLVYRLVIHKFRSFVGDLPTHRLPSIFSNLLTLCRNRHDFQYFANDCIASPCYLLLYNSFCDIYYFIHFVQMLFLVFSFIILC